MRTTTLVGLAALSVLVGGCARDGQIDVSSGVGITSSLNGCPVVGIPDGTGDVTYFNPTDSRSSDAIDVVGSITNLRSTCAGEGAQIGSNVTFDVVATRTNTAGARNVTMPFYSVVMRGGRDVVAKKVGSVTVAFADGQRTATASSSASAAIDAGLTRLPDDVREKLTRRRNPGDVDAAIDPLADPLVRDALANASFEHLIGFQLTDAQLAYNVTR